MGRDKSAFALTAYQQVVGRKFVDRLAHRALADAVAGGEVHFAGNGFSWLPFASLQALQDQIFDLLVQGAEGGREAVHGLNHIFYKT